MTDKDVSKLAEVGSGKGTNGVMDGEANVKKFLAWQDEVEDYKPFIYQGTLNISRIASECGLKRDVFYTNPAIRDTLLPALQRQLESDGILKSRAVQPPEVIPRQPRRSAASDDARIKQIQEENAALKAENRELRAQLEQYTVMAEVLHTSGRVPW
ncbi:DUF6262 family protein [Paraburkholderia sp. MM5384-R2]|uniref:DUF6262 family protein n=1 Tax=Paraburkholderia sp. MM5384-R2 TaxID=2723097 RepID=UPI001620A886|nr:DUF6262 family protein [Paraburkholderia sp. MM5384-R2]MBB5503160.1 hypothetical protein [Paraburkholderia sp. MM5384-R2]